MRNRRKGEKWSKSINVVGVLCRGEEIISRPQLNIFTYWMKKRRKKRKKKQFCTVAGKKDKNNVCSVVPRNNFVSTFFSLFIDRRFFST